MTGRATTRRLRRPGHAARLHREAIPHAVAGSGLASAPSAAGVPRPVPHVAARSALAGAAAMLPPLDAAWPVVIPHRPSRARRRLAALVAAGLVCAVVAAFAGTHVVLARFTDVAGVGSTTFSTGSSAIGTAWYLHDSPTPPTADTTAQSNLARDAGVPPASTLRSYDTSCDGRAERALVRGSGIEVANDTAAEGSALTLR